MTAMTQSWVEAGPFRAHLRHLMAGGNLTATEVATLAGVPPRLAASLLNGRRSGRAVRRIDPDSARALLQVTAGDVKALRTRQVPAAESRLRLRTLLRNEPDLARLADQLGATTDELVDLALGRSPSCAALLALRLVALVRATLADEAPAQPARSAA